MTDTSDLKDYTVCAAFYDSDCRATATVKARSAEDACALVVGMVDSGTLPTENLRYDPSDTFVYGVVEGTGDPFEGAHLVPRRYQEPVTIRDGDAVDRLIAAAREVVAAGRPSTLAPAHSRALDLLAERLKAFDGISPTSAK